MEDPVKHIAIIDYGLGNLFSIQHACEHVGMQAIIAQDKELIAGADAVLLPGVGAFGDAMDSLNTLGMVDFIQGLVSDGKPLIGVCLGLQLLMGESEEFGQHTGLGLIDGRVVPFLKPKSQGRVLKVPQVGWNTVEKPFGSKVSDPWALTPMQGLAEGSFMYFVHSYYVQPEDPEVILTESTYGNVRFCSSICCKNIFASQFHPERSGEGGLEIYRNIITWLDTL